MWDISVKVIIPGTCTIDPGNMASHVHVALKQQMGVQGGSTVCLIREKDECLSIDTGYEGEADKSPENRRRNQDRLRLLLDFYGHRVKEVTRVFITHFHMDHYGGIELFEGAEWFCHRLAHEELTSPLRNRFIPLGDGDQIIPNTSVVHTAGHTRGHNSLLWSTENRSLRVAICGDPILNLAWLQSGHIWKFNSDFYDVEAARKSIASLLQQADIIIPGHGQPFFVSTVGSFR